MTASADDIRIISTHGNVIDFSSLTHYSASCAFLRFSIKYVHTGCENYTINGRKYAVGAQSYLLANEYNEGRVHIESQTQVKGSCMSISQELLSEVVASYRRPDALEKDLGLDIFFSGPGYLERQYNARETRLGAFLIGLNQRREANQEMDDSEFDMDFYYTMCEKIVEDQAPFFRQYKKIKSVKAETKRELLRRILKGRDLIDQLFVQPLSMQFVAGECGISEYHFYRLFKTVFGISPNRYLIEKRLVFALQQLRKRNCTITELAALSGFSDIHSFSKSFKKRFGISPSVLRS